MFSSGEEEITSSEKLSMYDFTKTWISFWEEGRESLSSLSMGVV